MKEKVLQWIRYPQDKDFHLMQAPEKEVNQFVPHALSRLCENSMPPKAVALATSSTMLLAAMELALPISYSRSQDLQYHIRGPQHGGRPSESTHV